MVRRTKDEHCLGANIKVAFNTVQSSPENFELTSSMKSITSKLMSKDYDPIHFNTYDMQEDGYVKD